MVRYVETGPLPILAWARIERELTDLQINGLTNVEIMELHEDYQTYVEVWHIMNDPS